MTAAANFTAPEKLAVLCSAEGMRRILALAGNETIAAGHTKLAAPRNF